MFREHRNPACGRNPIRNCGLGKAEPCFQPRNRRFGSSTKPDAPEIVEIIERELAKTAPSNEATSQIDGDVRNPRNPDR
jgi:hypothetical protein